jgi:hypothetical protein
VIDQSLDLAERLVQQAESGRVDLRDLQRRARKLLEATVPKSENESLF